MDWPEVTKYRGVVSAQPHREEIIQDLYKTVQDPQKGVVHSGMIRYEVDMDLFLGSCYSYRKTSTYFIEHFLFSSGNCLWLSLSQLGRNLTGLFSTGNLCFGSSKSLNVF